VGAGVRRAAVDGWGGGPYGRRVLYLVHMRVELPHDLSAERAEELKRIEKARALELQRDGRWVHLWRVVGRYENYSVFDVADHDELHALLTSLPLFPFMDVTVTGLAQHPSALSAQPDRPTVPAGVPRGSQGSRAT
jgi:muconolactone D-isomerase